MPVGGRVAGKGVGMHNSGGSSDGKSGYTTEDEHIILLLRAKCLRGLVYNISPLIFPTIHSNSFHSLFDIPCPTTTAFSKTTSFPLAQLGLKYWEAKAL
jgi:hypothetical protein